MQAKNLALTDSLAKVVPGYPNQNLATKVTIHHLLTHTGGTGDIFGPEFDKHRLDLRTLADYVKLSHGLVVKPQSRRPRRCGRRRDRVQEANGVFAVVARHRDELIQDPSLLAARR